MARRRYTDEERATAVALLNSEGYPDTRGALVSVADKMGIPFQTLSRWAREQNNPPPPDLVNKKEIDLLAVIHAELGEIVANWGDKRGDAEYRALMTAFGILTDKMLLLTGKATARTEVNVNSPVDDLRSRIAGIAARQRPAEADQQPLRH